MVLATKPEEISKIFTCFFDFLKNEPDKNFSTTSFENTVKGPKLINIPLTLNEEAQEKLKSTMAPYKMVLQHGILPGSSVINYINVLGQFLSNIVLSLELRPQSQEIAEKLFKIWGSRDSMSARGLTNKLKNQSTSEAKSSLIKALNVSIHTLAQSVT
jgi:hypothetical protein